MNLSEALKQYRKTHHLVQKEVAGILGITREHYALIEEGHLFPSTRLISNISKKLQIKIEFIPNSDEEQPKKHIDDRI